MDKKKPVIDKSAKVGSDAKVKDSAQVLDEMAVEVRANGADGFVKKDRYLRVGGGEAAGRVGRGGRQPKKSPSIHVSSLNVARQVARAESEQLSM